MKLEKVLFVEIVVDVVGGFGRFIFLVKEVNYYDLIDFFLGMLVNVKKEVEKIDLLNVFFIK